MEYEEVITCDGKDETIKIKAAIPINPRLAQLIERSAIREFDCYYDEASECLVIKGDTLHTVA